MPIPFSCPHCNLETLVEDEYAGQSGDCARCGKSITVPFVPDSRSLQPDEVVVGIPRQTKRSVLNIALAVCGAVIVGAAVIVLMTGVFFPAVNAGLEAVRHRGCAGNLARIAEALLQYEADHGQLPPAFVADASGKPMHSWRVYILPYLDEKGLHRQYRFEEPWDSRHNTRLVREMPDVFACPSDPDAKMLGESNYMVMVGPRTLFPNAEARSTSDITDDRRSTILVVEAPSNGNEWTKPADLPVEKMQFMINGQVGHEIGSLHNGGAHVATADGQVHFLSDLTPSDYVVGMSTIRGGEPIPSEVLETLGN